MEAVRPVLQGSRAQRQTSLLTLVSMELSRRAPTLIRVVPYAHSVVNVQSTLQPQLPHAQPFSMHLKVATNAPRVPTWATHLAG